LPWTLTTPVIVELLRAYSRTITLRSDRSAD